MTMYVYDTGGEPVGVLFETFIYVLGGRPLGRIMGSRVHRLDGSYAGEWLHQMVVERPGARPRSIFPALAPVPPPVPSGSCFRRRTVADRLVHEDAFHRLYEGAGEGGMRQAAE